MTTLRRAGYDRPFSPYSCGRRLRKVPRQRRPPIGGRWELAEAESMEASAAAFMDVRSHVTGTVRIGNGGEVIVATREAQPSIPGVIDTVRQSPGMLAASARRARLGLTGKCSYYGYRRSCKHSSPQQPGKDARASSHLRTLREWSRGSNTPVSSRTVPR